MNPIRMRFMREKLTEMALEEQGEHLDKDVFVGLEVLDVGCGGGLLSEVCSAIAKLALRLLDAPYFA
jgi:polyprenyldihydroxybenzoate methyltransferase/3-demethylubiquinol 3-O-methyltransferase